MRLLPKEIDGSIKLYRAKLLKYEMVLFVFCQFILLLRASDLQNSHISDLTIQQIKMLWYRCFRIILLSPVLRFPFLYGLLTLSFFHSLFFLQ